MSALPDHGRVDGELLVRAFAALSLDDRRVIWQLLIEQDEPVTVAASLNIEVPSLPGRLHQARLRLVTAYRRLALDQGSAATSIQPPDC